MNFCGRMPDLLLDGTGRLFDEARFEKVFKHRGRKLAGYHPGQRQRREVAHKVHQARHKAFAGVMEHGHDDHRDERDVDDDCR